MTPTDTSPDLLTCDEMLTLDMTVGEPLEDLEDVLGPDAVWRLTETCGGRTVYIPRKMDIESCTLAQSVGVEIATWLYDRYGYGRLSVPMGPSGPAPRKVAAFRTILRRDLTHAQIAREMQCHVRSVERMRARLRNAGFI